MSPRRALPHVAVGLLALVFAWACAAFAWQRGLATFADDSVSYLIMGQVLSPWQAASPAVAEAFAREAFYPPLFPLLLAITGTAYDIALAHVLTALLVAACLPCAYALGARWLKGGWAAAAAVAVTALLPAMWINAKGILSEPLYCLLLLATLLALEAQESGGKRLWALALAMAAMAMTRTAALALVVAYALWALTRRERPFAARAKALVPALAAGVAYGAWVLIRPAESADVNLQFLLEKAQGFLGAQGTGAAVAATLTRQANAGVEAWIGSLLLFWVEGRPVRVALAAAVGVLALAGMGLRIRAGKADGWMMAGYLATFLAWPFYDQMGRFLFPALPVLVLYAFLAVGAALRALDRPAAAGHALLAVLIASVAAPGLAFIHQRSGSPQREAEIVDWYRTPDLAQARARARVQLDLFADLEAIRERTRPEARIMWVVPSYLALLAERRGMRAPASDLGPEAYREAVLRARADYVFVSAYHPRDTLSRSAWEAGIRALSGYAEVIQARKQEDGEISSVLFRVGPADRVAANRD